MPHNLDMTVRRFETATNRQLWMLHEALRIARGKGFVEVRHSFVGSANNCYRCALGTLLPIKVPLHTGDSVEKALKFTDTNDYLNFFYQVTQIFDGVSGGPVSTVTFEEMADIVLAELAHRLPQEELARYESMFQTYGTYNGIDGCL